MGWDVILSGMSTAIWAAIRGLDVRAILSSSGLLYSGPPMAVVDAPSDTKSLTSEIDETAKSVER